MKRSHLIAILVAVALILAALVAVPVLMLFQWRQTRETARQEMVLRVRVPESSGSSAIVINLDADGQYIIDDSIHSEEEIREKLRTVAGLHPDRAILVRGHRDTGWSTMTKAIAIIEDAGLWNISFATQDTPPE